MCTASFAPLANMQSRPSRISLGKETTLLSSLSNPPGLFSYFTSSPRLLCTIKAQFKVALAARCLVGIVPTWWRAKQLLDSFINLNNSRTYPSLHLPWTCQVASVTVQPPNSEKQPVVYQNRPGACHVRLATYVPTHR
jgi:hypothetical protein